MKRAITFLGAMLLASCVHAEPADAGNLDHIFARDATFRSVCDRMDIEGFRYYLFHHPDVRHAIVADSVSVLRPDMPPRNVQRDHYTMHDIPLFGMHQGVETITERHEFEAEYPEWAWLKIEVEPLPNDAFRLVWQRAEYETTGAAAMPGRLLSTHGPTGQLTFRRTAQCWELVEDSVSTTAG